MSDELTPTPEVPVEPTAATAEPDWLPARLERAKRSAANELLAGIGVESTDEAKLLIEEAKRIKAERMTEAEAARAEADALKARTQQLEAAIAARDLADAKRRILSDAKLPSDLLDVLSGDTEEAFTESVKRFLAVAPETPSGPPTQVDAAPSAPPISEAAYMAMSTEERHALLKSEEGRAQLAQMFG